MGVYDLNYGPVPATNPMSTFPTAPGTQQQIASSWFQQNPQASSSGIGAAINAPPVGGAGGGGTGLGTGLGMNLGTAQLALGGLGTIGNLWMAFNAQKLAKEQFSFQKGITNTNLANQIQSYNTSLADKINSRVAQEGGDASQAQAYVDNNKLTDERRN